MRILLILIIAMTSLSSYATSCDNREFFSSNMKRYKSPIIETYLEEYNKDGVDVIESIKYVHRGNQARIRDYVIYGMAYAVNTVFKDECMPQTVGKNWKGNGEFVVSYTSINSEKCELIIAVDGTADSGTYSYSNGVTTHSPEYNITLNRVSNSCK